MRSITTLTLTLALALTACTEDKNEPETTAVTASASATDGSASATDGTGTTAEPTTGTPTTSGTDSASVGTTDEPGTSSTSVSGTTTEPGTSSTTTEPGSTGSTTGGVEGDPWDPDPATCVKPADPLMVQDIEGAFCSAACMANADCPAGPAGTMSLCILSLDGMNPTNCALVCQVAMDGCPAGSSCKDLMDAMNPGVGVCTYP